MNDRTEKSPVLTHIFTFIIGISIGLYVKNQFIRMGMDVGKTDASSLKHTAPFDVELRPNIFESEISTLSEHQYSCNTLSAYEELTNLHSRAKELESKRKRGEANRARQATIERKANAASSAERAFRSCIATMVPELLSIWETKLKEGKLDLHSWNEVDEKSQAGITLLDLEGAADDLTSPIQEKVR